MDYFDILLAKKLSGGGGGGEITVEGLTVNDNGTYTAPSGKAYSPVVVNLPLGEKAITANGEYNASADDLKGYSKVTVNVAGFKVKDMPTGAISSFSDGTANPLVDLKIAINPVQDLHGYDNPWPAGGGKNLCPDKIYQTNARNYAIGTDNATDEFPFSLTSGQTYTFSYDATIDTSYTVYIREKNQSTATAYSGKTVTFTPTVTGNYKIVINSALVDTSIANYSKIQLEKGGSKTSYAPYSNICPIIGWTGANVYRTGSNVWDEQWESGGISITNGQNTPVTNAIRSKNYSSCKPNTSYYMANVATTSYVFWYDADKNYISYTSNPVNSIYKSPQNAMFFRLRIDGYGTTYNNDICINYPPTDTTYHAYNGTTTTIPLGQTVYGGELDVTTGVLTINTLIKTIDGVNEQVGGVWGATTYGYAVYVNMPVNKTANTICDKFEYTNKGYVNMELYTYVGGSGTQQTWTFILPNTVTSKAEANDWFSNNPTTLTYPLDSPITVQLTPTQVSSILGVNNIWADCGDVISGKYFASL